MSITQSRPQDVKVRYFAGGEWKSSIIAKQGKNRHEATKMARTYTAIPPAEGWAGGLPEHNGYKPTGKR